MPTIVVGIDGSEESNNALRFAFEEARLRGAGLHAVHAWEVFVGGLGGGLIWPPSPEAEQDILEDRERWLRTTIEEIVGDPAGVEISSTAKVGTPAEVLIAASAGADLLVVGSRGHGGFAGLLLGSVSQQCAHHAPCPVVIVRRSA